MAEVSTYPSIVVPVSNVLTGLSAAIAAEPKLTTPAAASLTVHLSNFIFLLLCWFSASNGPAHGRPAPKRAPRTGILGMSGRQRQLQLLPQKRPFFCGTWANQGVRPGRPS